MTWDVMIAFTVLVLTVADWQVDPPGAVAVARVVSRETRTQDGSFHLFSDPTTLSCRNGG